jgi:putative ATP-dependent endonuclease of OLD family
MARLTNLSIEGFRSIRDQIVLNFPVNQPVVLIGENNTGKSNIIRAIELMFGEFHPKFKKLEDYDHYNRDCNNPVIIRATISGLKGVVKYFGIPQGCNGFVYRAQKGQETDFSAIQTDDGKENKYVSGDLRDELLCVVVNSEQNLNYQLSYSTKYTLLSKVTKAFHDKLCGDPDKIEQLEKLFKDIQKTFLSVDAFKCFTSNMSMLANQMIANMSHGLAFDFSAYDPSNYFKSLRVHPTENGEVRAFEELGTGQQQILALSFAHAYAKSFIGQGLIFILDEPEAHLHPLAQKWLAKQFFKMAEDGLQIVITTHSPHFINLKYIDGLNLVRKDKETTYIIRNTAKSLFEHCITTGANSTKTRKETVVPFYSNQATAHILSGFFANKVILVEGLTEELSLPIYFARIGFDTTEQGVEVIGVNGKGNLAKWWRLFTLYEIPTFVCFDNDIRSGDDTNGSHRKDALKAIGILENKFDSILGFNSWNLSDKYCVFGTDFEKTMRESFTDYATIEATKQTELGSSSKHIIARETAKSVDFNKESIGKLNFKLFVDKIKILGDESACAVMAPAEEGRGRT